MAITIARLEVEKAATILNAIISFIQYTFGLAVVAILTKIISNVHSANTWSVITRELQSSLWPTLLRTDSSSSHTSPRVAWLSKLGILSSLLVAVAGVVSPLGLKPGPLVASRNFQPMDAVYVKDTSPLASATPSRSDYIYSRLCGYFNYIPCPGNTNVTTEIHPSTIAQFNSTPHGPFNMQLRRYYKTINGPNNQSTVEGRFSTLQSFILRDDIFAVEGGIVDLTDTPGIGLTNHTMPHSMQYGATWSQEVLWLEPSTACVDTNLTIDYTVKSPYDWDMDTTFNLTDRGGFVNLTRQLPTINLTGQNINLYQRAYKGAVLSNYYSMIALNNLTRNQSSVGKSYKVKFLKDATFKPGVMQSFSLEYLSNATDYLNHIDAGYYAIETICKGYMGGETANITNVSVHCGAFLGPPYRVDGGDDKQQDIGSNWRHNLYVCASATKASIQRVDYSLNGTADLTNLQLTRSPIDKSVLWAVEKTNMTISDVHIYWGRVSDSYESNSNLSTIRASEFYIPASHAGGDGSTALFGQAHILPGVAWGSVYNWHVNGGDDIVDYSGTTNAALLKKYQTIISSNHTQGVAHICNLIWTDLVVNNLIGTDTSAVLSVAEYHPSVTYDLKFAIPLALLVLIWLPSFLTAIFLLVSGMLKLSDIKKILNHTSVGRVVTGHSDLAVKVIYKDQPVFPMPLDANESDWAETAGKIPVSYASHKLEPSDERELFMSHHQSMSFVTIPYGGR